MPGEDLPQAYIGLKDSYRVGLEHRRRNAIEGFGRFEKAGNGGIVEIVKLGEDRILIAEAREFADQQPNSLTAQTMFRRTPAVDLAEHEIDLQRPVFGRIAREGHQPFHNLVAVGPITGFFGPIPALSRLGIVVKVSLPCIKIARDMGLAIGVQFQAGNQNG